MKSDHFEIMSTAGEKATREILVDFERVRDFFVQTLGKSKGFEHPLRVVVFRTRKEFEEYRFKEFSAAYYRPGAERDYIVLTATLPDTFPVALHEYFHLVAKHTGIKIPSWLNEGMAELYSTLETGGEKVLVGRMIAGRHAALLTDRWVPLLTILDVDHNSPYYNEKSKASSFYNESWALAHMLCLSKEYRPGFDGFLKLITKGVGSREALEKTYLKPVEAIDRDLQTYLRGTSFQALQINMRLAKPGGPMAPVQADPFRVRFTLVELGARDPAERRKQLQGLVTDFPNEAEGHAALGYAEWAEGGDPLEAFRKAYQRGHRAPQFLSDFGRLAERTDPEEAVAVLTQLVELQPAVVSAKLDLASALLRHGSTGPALAALRQIKRVEPEEAGRLFRLTAHTHARMGSLKEAQVALSQWKQYATEADQTDIARLQTYLEHAERAAAAGTAGAGPQTAARRTYATELPAPEGASAEDGGRPRLARQEGGVVRPPEEEPKHLEVSGEFQFLDCQKPPPVMVVLTVRGKQRFLLDKPSDISIRGLGTGTTDLSCGPQKRVAVRVEYEKPAAGTAGIDGLVRGLVFGEE